MDFLIENKEFDLSLLQANHILESAVGLFKINTFYCESTDVVYEASLSDMVDRAIKAIEKIIQAIVDFCASAISKVKSFFLKKEHQNKLDTLVKNLDKIENPNEKISIYESEKLQKAFNVYIREVLKLERKLSLLNVDTSISKSPTSKNNFVIECHKIMKEMDELNKKFEVVLTNETEPIVQMAKKDAVRFSQKDLNNVKVDFDAVEKGSKEVLQKFKVDMNGCEVPEKLNIFQKMANKVATNARRTVQTISTYKHKNLVKILASAALLVTASQAKQGKGPGAKIKTKVVDPVKNKVSEFIKSDIEQNKRDKIQLDIRALTKEMKKRMKNNDIQGAQEVNTEIIKLQKKLDTRNYD